jgi:hypothetical protein
MGSYSSVASLPDSLRIILEPPGCSERKPVTYRSGILVQIQHAYDAAGVPYIVHFAVQNNPATLFGVMFCDYHKFSKARSGLGALKEGSTLGRIEYLAHRGKD